MYFYFRNCPTTSKLRQGKEFGEVNLPICPHLGAFFVHWNKFFFFVRFQNCEKKIFNSVFLEISFFNFFFLCLFIIIDSSFEHALVLKKFVANFGWHLLAKCEFTPPQSLNPISDFRKPSTNFQAASRNRIWWVSTSKLCACVGTFY